MPTLSPFIPRTHFDSHCVSCGHTLPHTAGSELASEITRYAPSKSPSATFAINAGMCILTGHPETHGIFLQLRHRFASSIACSSVYPRATSSKLRARTSGAWVIISFFFGDMFGISFHRLSSEDCIHARGRQPLRCGRSRRASSPRRNRRGVRRNRDRRRRRTSPRRRP